MEDLNYKKERKFIFVTGGVVSGLGKGVSAASIGRLLKRRGLNIFSIKFDPYLNYDPGTMSPLQHGEVYVTKDGAETDLDLGHYERIINTSLTKESSISSGKIYSSVIEKERRGEYLGKTVQIIPHITNEIKQRLYEAFDAKGDTDVCICEIGGTIGDIESLPFIEAIRQVRREIGYENTFFMHNTLVPYLYTSLEPKTKPTQHSVKELTGLGIQPDAILLRTEADLDKETMNKVALFCNVKDEAVIFVKDVKLIYEVGLNLQKQHLDDLIVKHLRLDCAPVAEMSDWKKFIKKIYAIEDSINIALVGKYTKLHDAYLSVVESLKHAGYVVNKNIKIKWVDSNKLDENNVKELLGDVDGIIVPGGFGKKGIEGMILAAKFSRENKIPFFGICLGMQIAMIEFARNVLNLKDADSSEFNPKTSNKIIDYLPNQYKNINLGATMRLGEYKCELVKKSKVYSLYKNQIIYERHRHRYEFNNEYKELFENNGLKITGVNPDTNLCEIVELDNHPFYIACQFHPEFLSRPLEAHPLFLGFIKECNKKYE
ncbi:MAG: CTP synthase [Bacillales bacterium]